MSHAMGLMKFPDRKDYLYGEYDGTADVMLPQFYATPQEVEAHWREGNWPDCSHEYKTWVDVEVFTNYGDGYWWKAKACPICNTLQTNYNPYELDYNGTVRNGCPDWCKDWCDE